MRYYELTETADEPFTDFIVYGSFREPATEKNFFIVRMPSGRVPWSKKIVPAINRLVRSFYSPQELQRDRERTRSYGKHKSEIYWQVDGEPTDSKRLWDRTDFARYEWDGNNLVKVVQV